MQGYPTIKVFGADKGAPTDYNGARDSSSMAAYAIEQWSSLQPPPEACCTPPPTVKLQTLF